MMGSSFSFNLLMQQTYNLFFVYSTIYSFILRKDRFANMVNRVLTALRAGDFSRRWLGLGYCGD